MSINKQKELLSEIRKQLELLSQHIDYMYDKEVPLRQLDLDVLMKKIHLIYEHIYNFKPEKITESIENEVQIPVVDNPVQEVVIEKTEQPKEEKETVLVEKTIVEKEEIIEPEPVVEKVEETEKTEIKDVFLNFETVTDSKNSDEEDSIQEENKVEKEKTVETNDVFEEQILENIAERLEKKEDDSLAAKLQHQPIGDLREAIGVNDKFLFVNDLFFGSMEKYNKSINQLNEFKTYYGARTYFLEMKIDLQWDTKTEAYKKLELLIMRKFGL